MFGYRYAGLYYLQSRYYNPEWGRFINADAIAGEVGELIGHNLFKYCKNNPINMSDKEGFRPAFDSKEDEEAYYEYIHSVREGSSIQETATFIDTKSPPPPETGYKAPKNPDKAKKRIPAPGARGETGWLDKKGNVWVPDVDMDGG